MMTNTPRTFVGTTSFQVTGTSCGHCQRTVSEEIGHVSGVRSVTVDRPPAR